jgi:hypothetical protein
MYPNLLGRNGITSFAIAIILLLSVLPLAHAGAADYDILMYIEDEAAKQECDKDVRCWSSVTKFQQFMAGAPLTPLALAARVEGFQGLLEDLWKKSHAMEPAASPMIGTKTIQAVLDASFPQQLNEDQSTRFALAEKSWSVDIGLTDVEDYDDNIEGYRLLQSWLLNLHTADDGSVQLARPYSPEGVQLLRKWLPAFDIMVLRRAKNLAGERKKMQIDDKIVADVFKLLREEQEPSKSKTDS